LPFTISNTGVTLGVIFFILSAYVTKLSLCLYIDIAKIIAPNKYDIKISALSEMLNMPKLGIFTNLIIILNCFGTATSLLIAASDFVLSLVKNGLSSDYTGVLLDKRFWITMEIFIVIPIIFRKSLVALKSFSLFSIFSISYLTFSIIFSYFIFGKEEPSVNPKSIEPVINPETSFVQNILKKFMAISIIIFAYSCQQNVFPIYSELKPSHRPYISYVIFYAIFFCTIVYLTIGFCGYATFGDSVQSNILNNYDDSNIIINIARLGMAIYSTFTYSVQMHPCRESIKKEIISYKIRRQRNYGNINENDNQDEKIKLLSNYPNNNNTINTINNYGTTSNFNNHFNENSNNTNNKMNNKNSLLHNSCNSNIINIGEDDDEFESQMDANDADDERSGDSRQNKNININIFDNLSCPTNAHIDNMSSYDNETLFNSITLILLISSYMFAMICNDFGKILSIVGATCCTTLTFILPGYLYVKITKGITFKRVEAMILIVLGVIIGILGTIAAF
jgi:amino acid permease